MNYKDILKNKTFCIASICVITVIVCTAAFFVLKETNPPKPIDPAKIRIVAVNSDSIGVDPKSDFKVVCGEEYDKSQIKSALTVTPNEPYKLSKASGNDYLLRFEKALQANRIYKFSLNVKDADNKRSWAFQTKKTFRVVRTMPRDKGTWVPTDSGIEITFSHDNYDDINNYFEISPPVKGRFERHKKTVVFIPKGLAEATVYTVKLKKGVSLKGSNDRIDKDYVFQFETEKKTYSDHIFFEDLHNVLPKTAPVIRTYANTSNANNSVTVEVYRYPGDKGFLDNLKTLGSSPYWAYNAKARTSFKTAGLDKETTFKTKIVTVDYQDYLCFPTPLPEGYYLINCTAGSAKAQTHIQVNNLVSYITVAKDKTLIWVNNAGSGQPVEGCTVTVDDKQAVNTNNDGIAIIPGEIPVNENQSNYYFKIASNMNPNLFAVVSYRPDYSYDFSNVYFDYDSNNANNLYWNYLFFDRGLYMPTDTVNVWGLIKSRTKKGQPKKVTLELRQPNWGDDAEQSLIDSKVIDLTPTGTLSGGFVLPNLTAGSYSIAVRIDNNLVIEKYFDVSQYTKPAYKIDVTSDKQAVFEWEPINLNIQTSFFEGTPVSGLKLAYDYQYNNHLNSGINSADGKLNCDKNGSAGFKVPPVSLGDSWHPTEFYFSINNARAEEQEVRARRNVTVFPRDTMISVDGKRAADKGIVVVQTNKIDLAPLNNKPIEYFSEDDYRGLSLNIKLKAQIYEVYWDRKEIGDYYDFINKRTEKKYEYFEVDKLIKSLQFTTVKGKYQFEFPFDMNKHYRVEVTGFDSRKNTVVETEEVYGYNFFDGEKTEGYNMVTEDPTTTYRVGDKVSLNVQYNNKELKLNKNGKILYLVFRNGLIDYTASTKPRYSFNFKKELIPNVYVKSVYFDGTNLAKIDMREIGYDNSEKNLQITLKTDKHQYKPGETADVDIEVKDPNGRPVKASMNLSVVDESFFALYDQTVETLSELYSPRISSGLLADYISHEDLKKLISGGAEYGGEGGDQSATRSIFKDTAFFQSIETNAQGRAKTKFKLPDNLTSWRITYQGVTEDIGAGSGKTNITTKLPFFVDTIFNSIFMEGDTPYITVRSFGTEVNSSTDINYRAIMQGPNGFKKLFNSAGKGYNFTNIGLGELKEGKYSITIEASCGKYRDAVKRDFRVEKTLLESTRVKYKKLVNGYQLEKGKSLTTIYFYNAEPAVFYEALNSLLYAWGERVDQKLARKRAGELMKLYFNEEPYWWGDEEFDGKMFQTNDGGIALFRYSSSEPDLSAKMCSLDRDSFDKNSLRYYFYSILDNKESIPEDVAASYWGLGALSEPVLLEVQNLLKSKEIDLKQKIILGLALAELGDEEGAREVYTGVIAKNSRSVAPYMYIQYGKDRDDTLEATSLCSVLAMKIGNKNKNPLFNYVKDNSPKDILLNLEKLMFVTNSLPKSNQVGRFSYEIDGVKKDVILKNIERYKLVLTSGKATRVKFSDFSGDIMSAEHYVGPIKDLMNTKDKLVKLTRTYSVGDVSKKRFKQSDLIKITLQPGFERNAPDDYYEITDILPSGLRFVGVEPNSGSEWYYYQISGQTMVFEIWPQKDKPRKLVYYARAVSPGAFTADNALIKHGYSDVAGFTDRTKLIIDN